MAYSELPCNTPEKQQSTAEALTASYRASMRIQAMRMDDIAHEASSLRHELSQSQHQLSIWQHTLSWRLTAPLRVVRHLSKGQLPTGRKISDVYRRLQEIYQDEGAAGVRFRISHRLARSSLGRAAERLFERKPTKVAMTVDGGAKKTTNILTHEEKINQVYSAHVSQDRLKDFTPRILIIAELSLRQCAKYRVWQKEGQLRSLGWLVDVVDWRETEEALSALQVCTEVIFYRVPAFPAVELLLKEARRLELSPWWRWMILSFLRKIISRTVIWQRWISRSKKSFFLAFGFFVNVCCPAIKPLPLRVYWLKQCRKPVFSIPLL